MSSWLSDFSPRAGFCSLAWGRYLWENELEGVYLAILIFYASHAYPKSSFWEIAALERLISSS
jgi:hypothetical protein